LWSQFHGAYDWFTNSGYCSVATRTASENELKIAPHEVGGTDFFVPIAVLADEYLH
jgi:hypothetical protein